MLDTDFFERQMTLSECPTAFIIVIMQIPHCNFSIFRMIKVVTIRIIIIIKLTSTSIIVTREGGI